MASISCASFFIAPARHHTCRYLAAVWKLDRPGVDSAVMHLDLMPNRKGMSKPFRIFIARRANGPGEGGGRGYQRQ